MAAISELIRTEGNGTLSFGDYTLGAKAKLDNYEFHGDKYKVKRSRRLQSWSVTDCLYMNLYRVQLSPILQRMRILSALR